MVSQINDLVLSCHFLAQEAVRSNEESVSGLFTETVRPKVKNLKNLCQSVMFKGHHVLKSAF